ncbi:Cell wall anchored protein [Lasiodiplodia theobromae]|uniref:Kelch repeat-containing protein n=1 Tax=Lasiodiplodia theobromae TaxID=45133 RepID=A0A5N5DJY1_9PEZI|nr:Cell wall anchored protein [Lasiodiplodia theobromae]KAB2578219.1 Kelch repeat-containing protein [Lasiodiplodia theobromae]KAF4534163.1 Cell wall anchored protein [Lasiodiplodia theobromae]
MCLPLRRSGLRLLSLWALSLGAMAQSSTLNFTNATALDYDPVGLMCARWEHQTVLKGDMIYIDGGLETIYDGDERWTDEFYLGLNYYLLGINTSESWNWETNLSISTWNKSASTPRPPTSLRGHLFQGLPSDPKIYLYGGADFTSNSSQHNYSSSNAGLLWAYDTVERGDWESINISEASLWQPTRGAHAEAPDLGLAFYLNGEAGTVESIEVWGNLSTQTAHLEGMIILDTANATGRTAWNVSTEAMTGGTPRSGAGMVYVSEMGESGALVVVGGIAREPLINDDPASGELINLNEIQIWDVDSWLSSPSTDNNNGTWYTQTATGTVPALRADFCLTAATAADGSSHNIYLYGGRNPKSGTLYDDVYALSLPSFTWTKLFEGQSPRWGHTCHLVPNSTQLLTLGGALDLNHATCDWEWHGVAVLDVWSVTWNNYFDAAARPYKVSQGVAEVVGGGDEGGATLTAPAGGWETAALAGLFKQSAASSSTTTSTAAASGAKRSKTGAIVGGVVGGVCGVALVALHAFFLLRRRRRRMAANRNAAELDHAGTQRHEAVGSQPPDKPQHDFGANAELPGDVGAQELDGEDQFERIVELDAGADAPRFEMAGSGMSPKEGEARGEEDTLKRLRGES